MSGNRMDLETYVQRYYLEKILYAANRRFANMSAGQFELRMVDEENAGKGKNRGLDLMVYSNAVSYTHLKAFGNRYSPDCKLAISLPSGDAASAARNALTR